MKKIIFALLLLAFSATQESQASSSTPSFHPLVKVAATPPAIVVIRFRAIFGNVRVREWKLRSDGNWRAHFLRNGIPWEATFSPSGVLVKSERD